jgi:hypothetical protein
LTRAAAAIINIRRPFCGFAREGPLGDDLSAIPSFPLLPTTFRLWIFNLLADLKQPGAPGILDAREKKQLG